MLPFAPKRSDHDRHLEQHLERQRPLRRHRTAIGRRLIQLHVPPTTAIAHIHTTGGLTTHIQDLEPVPEQRMERMRDHQRTQKPVGRHSSMR